MARTSVRGRIASWLSVAACGGLLFAGQLGFGADIPDVQRATAALSNVLDARLALEHDRLARLNVLRSHDHASWREVAEQETVIAGLKADRKAVGEFTALLERLGSRLGTTTTGRDTATYDGVSLPGSVRLVGWFRSESTGDAAATADSFDWSGFDHQVRVAKQHVESLETGSDTTPSLARARLEFNLAQAERDLARVLVKLPRRAERPAARRVVAVGGESPNSNALNGSGALLQATRKVAAVEAAATGVVHAAAVELRLAQGRLESYQELHSKGHASQAELDLAAKHVHAVEALNRQAIADHERLVRSYEKLGAVNEETDSASELTVDDWFLAQSGAVSRLVALAWHEAVATAQAERHAVRLTLLQSLQAKLQAAESHANRREQAFLSLEIESLQAGRQAALERAAALRLEQRRFVVQVQEQSRQSEKQTPAVTLVSTAGDSAVTWAYLESPAAAGWIQACDLDPLKYELFAADFVRLGGFIGQTPTETRPIFSHRLCDVTCSSLWTPLVPPLSPLAPTRPVVLHGPLGEFDFPSYPDYYHNGIRRSDLPFVGNRTTPYGGPWYFPGAPTNYRQPY